MADYLIPVETRLVAAVRTWLNQSRSNTTDASVATDDIGSLLEPFIGGCIAEASFPETQGWVSDGVVQLKIIRLGVNRVGLRGVTWLMSQTLVPFDIRLTALPNQTDQFASIEFSQDRYA